MKRWSPTFSRVVFVLLFCLGVLQQMGCADVVAGRRNHALMRAHLPITPDFKGVVFILEEPPRADFAYLLAQAYPESHVVVIPALTDPSDDRSFAYSEGSNPRTVGRGNSGWSLRPADGVARSPVAGYRILRGRATAGEPEVITCAAHTLPKVMIFHQMRMIAVDELPEAYATGRTVRLRWRSVPVPSDMREGPEEGLVLVIGLVLPPWPTRYASSQRTPQNQELEVRIAGRPEFPIRADEDAERGWVIGWLWRIPLINLYSRRAYPFAIGSPFRPSPGGWANFLESMFENQEILTCADSIREAEVTERSEWFENEFQRKGFTLEPLPGPVGFGKSYPTCGMRLASDPDSPVLRWNGLHEDGNWLDTVIDTGSDRLLPPG